MNCIDFDFNIDMIQMQTEIYSEWYQTFSFYMVMRLVSIKKQRKSGARTVKLAPSLQQELANPLVRPIFNLKVEKINENYFVRNRLFFENQGRIYFKTWLILKKQVKFISPVSVLSESLFLYYYFILLCALCIETDFETFAFHMYCNFPIY